MAALGSLEALLNALPEPIKGALLAYTREWARGLAFGAPEADSVVRTENFRGALVPFTTSGTANAEVAVSHMLARTPRFVVPALNPSVVGMRTPVLEVTTQADATYLYLASAETNVPVLLYVE